MAVIQNVSVILAVLASLSAVLYKPLTLRVEVLGLNRPLDKIENIHGEGFQTIPDTLYTEDLHYHEPSGLLFGTSEENVDSRSWFPAIDKFNVSRATDCGTIIVIDPETKITKRLTLPNFGGPFITHGIDIWSSPSDPTSILIFAVNHLANPAYIASNGKILPEARSQLEVFQHTIGTDSATHLRSIWHPLIRTPNDIYAIDDKSIYVSNDHHYRSGPLRAIEDAGFDLTPWSDVIHVSISSLESTSASEGVTATVALSNIQNPNGLAHGPSHDTIIINRAASGVMVFAHSTPPTLTVNSTVQLPCTIDNPTYFHDPYAKATGRDASGYVQAGMVRAIGFPSKRDPPVVWLVQADGRGGWSQRKIFQDDGRAISTGSTGVLVAIDPKENGGKKQAWLFVTGPLSLNVVSTKIDL